MLFLITEGILWSCADCLLWSLKAFSAAEPHVSVFSFQESVRLLDFIHFTFLIYSSNFHTSGVYKCLKINHFKTPRIFLTLHGAKISHSFLSLFWLFQTFKFKWVATHENQHSSALHERDVLFYFTCWSQTKRRNLSVSYTDSFDKLSKQFCGSGCLTLSGQICQISSTERWFLNFCLDSGVVHPTILSSHETTFVCLCGIHWDLTLKITQAVDIQRRFLVG